MQITYTLNSSSISSSSFISDLQAAVQILDLTFTGSSSFQRRPQELHRFSLISRIAILPGSARSV
jgi:hypothetical protein